MLRIHQLKMPVKHSKEDIPKKVADYLGIKSENIIEYSIFKRSIDARDKHNLHYVYAIDVVINCKLTKKFKPNELSEIVPFDYKLPDFGSEKLENRPIIVGFGPCGMFAAYLLALKGFRPIVLERGLAVEDRQKDIEEFFNTGRLNTESNALFGEGGAGTFSDGKLNTLVKDKDGLGRFVLETFVKFGANEDILYDAKPHIGTDKLIIIVKELRRAIISLGGNIIFGAKLSNILIDNNKVTGIEYIKDNELTKLATDVLVLALGHSARDTFEMLNAKMLYMEPKAFAMGVRVVHPQSLINKSQYGEENLKLNLPAAAYKLTYKSTQDRGVYSFCMCPGGYVVNSSSEEGMTVVNGMSYSDRSGDYANSAIVVTVNPEDFANEGFGNDALSGVNFQRKFEKLAFNEGQGNIPYQTLSAFNDNVAETRDIDLNNSVKGLYTKANVRACLPDYVGASISEGMKYFGSKIQGFNNPDTIILGVETRTSSPIRISRDESFQANISGIYPAGEGAGYAGGIMSAGLDGIKTAEKIIKKYKI